MMDGAIRGGERWTTAKRRLFLETLADSCNVSRSLRVVGLSMGGAYRLRAKDPAFAAEWADALRIGYERLEEALLRRTLIGVNAIEGGGDDAADRRLSADEVKLAIFLLARYRATVEGEQERPARARRASSEEVDAALTAKLDALEKRIKRGG